MTFMMGQSSQPRPPHAAVAVTGGNGAPPEEGPDAMPGDTVRFKVLIHNPEGFHMRPVTSFAELARTFQSTVTVAKDDRVVDGKSPLEMLFLAAVQGSELTVEARGPDAREAVAALEALMERWRQEAEGYPPLPPKG